MSKSVAAIYRAAQFSPNSVQKDAAILESVVDWLDADVVMYSEDAWDDEAFRTASYDYVLSMARSERVLEALADAEQRGAKVINRTVGVRNCTRSVLDRLMRQYEIPMPSQQGAHGYWVKRGDAAAQEKGDVSFAADEAELAERIKSLEARGISDYVVSAHVVGDLVKFYGVAGSGFFRYYYPTDDGQTKFDDERHNGMAHHYTFRADALQQTAEQLASTVKIDVYGGDCIVTADGHYYIIDFNDWPSFSRCKEEAAAAIAGLVK